MATTKLTQTGAQVQADLNLTENLQDAFSTSSTYAVGAYVIYNSKLWRCHTAVSSAGAWTGTTNWTEVKLDDLTDDCLKLSGGTMTGNLNANSDINLTGNESAIRDALSNRILQQYGNTTILGQGNSVSQSKIRLHIDSSANSSVVIRKGQTNEYNVLDADNTQANPTLAGTESTLTGLKVNGTSYAVPTPHTINTYTIGTLSADDQAKIANDIANQYPIIVAGNTYTFYGADQYWVQYVHIGNVSFGQTISSSSYFTVSYSLVNHTLSYNSGTTTIAYINNEEFNYSSTNGALLTKMTIGGQSRVFGAMSTYALTTAPTANNTDGGIRLVVLTSEPATYYNGYYYIIAPST